jgi:hypothetical protein
MLQTCFGCCLSKSILLAMERVIFLFFAGLIKPRSHRIAAFPSAFLPTLQLLHQVPLLLVCFFACTEFVVRLFFPLLTHVLIATLSAGHPCFGIILFSSQMDCPFYLNASRYLSSGKVLHHLAQNAFFDLRLHSKVLQIVRDILPTPGRATLWRYAYIILAERSFNFCLACSTMHRLSSGFWSRRGESDVFVPIIWGFGKASLLLQKTKCQRESVSLFFTWATPFI